MDWFDGIAKAFGNQDYKDQDFASAGIPYFNQG
jgi:hypothetical protein